METSNKNMPHSKPQKKRKRGHDTGRSASPHGRPAKQAKGDGSQRGGDVVKHALLAQYYPKLQTLRDYTLSSLPSSSRLRRKRIASLGVPDKLSGKEPGETELRLGQFLDSTLVAGDPAQQTPEDSKLREQYLNLSQKADDSHVTLSDGEARAVYSQSELVDYVIWSVFSKSGQSGTWPKHLLCDGFRRNAAPKNQGGAAVASNSLPGLYRVYENSRVQALKQSPWPLLLTLLGKSGDFVMIHLLRECSVFMSLEVGKGNYYQMSGEPISELTPLNKEDSRLTKHSTASLGFEKSPSEIVFVRSRMLYARAALNARGLVHFGLRHIHVLNRFPAQSKSKDLGAEKGHNEGGKSLKNKQNALRVMMYIFPRQFGLHNAFTSPVDHSQTAQKFQDYTLREEEIIAKFAKPGDKSRHPNVHAPKRLRGSLSHLIERLQTRHSRCSYAALLQHYCPVHNQMDEPREQRPSKSMSQAGRSHKKHQKSRRKSNQPSASIVPNSYSSLIELATPISGVSAFCQAVLSKIIPNDFWGAGDTQSHNKKMVLRKVDHFVRLRRFETMSLHEVMNGLKITDIEWLAPPSLKGQKCSQTDFRKRTEIFLEFLYYLFDSLLIPLIRSNFYVTESNVHRYRLFYFRHDVWRYVAEPAMTAIRTKMFEEVKLDDAMKILDSRRLGFSQVRLLPKETSVRPITNLRRRTLTRGNRRILGPSINSILGPVQSMLKLEKSLHPDRLGATMFSVGDIYKRVKSYKQRLGVQKGNFYIAKVDVQAAFDTIPQQAIIDLMKSIPTHNHYKIVKHVEVKPNDSGTLTGVTTTRRWHSSAKAAKDMSSFLDLLETSLAASRKNTVFIDSVVQRPHQSKDLLALMTSHIQQNLVKLGKKYYRQKDGIPQGSILSSLLCNFFYADLERRHLQFLQSEDCVVLRLIDDFLLITTDRKKASRFVQVMHQGMPEYGVTVSPNKTLVNFDLEIGDMPVPRIPANSTSFPYCGTRLDCRTLEIAKDRAGVRDPVISNALTVEFARLPGQNFKRKVLNAFRIQSHLMFFDTSHNSPRTTLRNIYDAFSETATKMWAYAKCLPQEKQPGPELLATTVTELIDVAFLLLTGKSRKARYPGYECAVKKSQVAWLALHAFKRVLEKKQARYRRFIAWLDIEIQKLTAKKEARVNIIL